MASYFGSFSTREKNTFFFCFFFTWGALAYVFIGVFRLEADTTILAVMLLTYTLMWVDHWCYGRYLTIMARESSRALTTIGIQTVFACGSILANMTVTVIDVVRTVFTCISLRTHAPKTRKINVKATKALNLYLISVRFLQLKQVCRQVW